MPKSRHRKNHKKKVASFKKRRVDNANAANKEMMRIQEDLMKKWKEKQESEKEEKPLNPNPETLQIFKQGGDWN